MAEIFFHVDGDPRPQPRPRAGVRKIFDRHTGAPRMVVRAYDDGSAENWKALVVTAARPYLPSDPIAVPVTLQLAFYLERPERLKRNKDPDGKMPSVGPRFDCDNGAKAVLDCLTQVRLWVDDGHVWRLLVSKQWTEKHGGRPGLDCWISWDEEAETTAAKPRAKPVEQEAMF